MFESKYMKNAEKHTRQDFRMDGNKTNEKINYLKRRTRKIETVRNRIFSTSLCPVGCSVFWRAYLSSLLILIEKIHRNNMLQKNLRISLQTTALKTTTTHLNAKKKSRIKTKPQERSKRMSNNERKLNLKPIKCKHNDDSYAWLLVFLSLSCMR